MIGGQRRHSGGLMRTLMLGSSALASTGLAICAAQAADGVTLTIGGRYMAAPGGLLHEDFAHPFFDEGDLRNYVFKQDVEVHFKGEATLDNGLVVGARIELEGGTSADQIDEVFAYFRSARFGEIRFGDTLEALSQLCYLVPSASGELFGADSPFFNFSNAGIAGYAATNATCLGIDDKVTKLVYFTQPFTGFTFALSFAPDDTQDTRNTVDGAGTRFRNDLGQNSENLSVAVNYQLDIDGVSVIVGGGATRSFDREATFPFFDLDGDRQFDLGEPPCDAKVDERESYRGHVVLEYAGFTVGGAVAYRVNSNACFDGADGLVYGAGGTYAWDAWSIGLGWTHGEYDIGLSPVADEHDIVAFTAEYDLAPGITVDAVVEYSNYDSGILPSFDYEGLAVGIGTLIIF
ncbi:MAG: porin [Vicinamibacterales bacterium]